MLTETILLDIASAERQINQLEAELRRLSKPVEIPVDIQTGDLSGVRRELGQADQSVSSLNSELEETTRELRRVDDAAGRAGRELDDTGQRGIKAFGGLGVAVAGFGAALVAVQGLRAFIGFADIAIGKASDLAESTSKTEVVFGDLADNIKQFAGTAPQALGLSTQAALEATASFGNLFTALGLSQDAAADLSPDIVQLAADLASFNNIEVGDALEKLRSGLVGEAEPLRTLGVAINEAAVQAKALELGLVGSTGELSEAAKVQARYALILEQTTTAQGDFARTADGIANKQRTLNAEFDNFQAKVGEALIPAFEALLDAAPQVITALEDLIPVIQNLATSVADLIGDGEGLAGFVQNLAAIPDALGVLGSGVQAVGNFSQAITSLFTLNPGAFFDNIGQGIDDIQSAATRFDISSLRNGLVNALQAGVDPALALADALAALTEINLDPEQFADVSQALIGMTNLNPRRLIDLSRHLQANGAAAGLAADDIQKLREQIAILLAPNVLSPEAARIQLPGTNPEDAIAISATAKAILELSNAGGSLENFAPDLGATGFTEALDTMTEAMDAARGALRDDEGEIVTDLQTFAENLQDALTAKIDFRRNISILREQLGLGALADAFEAAGQDSAQALADALSDPAAASKANSDLLRAGEELAQSQFAGFQTEIQQLIAGYEPPEVVIPLTFGGLPDIPISALTAGGIVNGAVSLTIINPIAQDIPTEAARGAQIIGSVNRRVS